MSSKAKLKPDDKEQKFVQYCKDTMPITVFNSLRHKMGVSKPTLLKYLQEPNYMPYEALKTFARMLNANPIHLHLEYNAGIDRMTAREYQDMIADYMAEYNAEQQYKEIEGQEAYTGLFNGYLKKLKEV
jgi:hypothetical protein